MAKVRHLPAFDGTVFVDIGQHHLFLLDGIESGLSNICGFLAGTPIHLGAEGLGPAPFCSLRLNQTGFHQLFERGAGRLFGLLGVCGQVRACQDVAHDAGEKG